MILALFVGTPALAHTQNRCAPTAQGCCCEGAEQKCEMPVANPLPATTAKDVAHSVKAAPVTMACWLDLSGQRALAATRGPKDDCPCWETAPPASLLPAQATLPGSSELFLEARLELQIESPPTPRAQRVKGAPIDHREQPPPKLLFSSFSLFPLPPPKAK